MIKAITIYFHTKVYILLFILLIISSYSYSQTLTKGQKPDPLFAKYCLKFNNYFDGLHEFKALLKLKPKNDYYRWGVGYCELHLNKNIAASIPYFKEVLSHPDANAAIWYDLGEAYFITQQFEKAKDAFDIYINTNIKDNHSITAKRWLEMIANARELMKAPVDVKIENLGPVINTEYPEFNPLINSNEKFLIYSMQNPNNNGKYRNEDGYFASDIYNSHFRFGKWRKRRKFSSLINSRNIEVGVYLSPNASVLITYKEDLTAKHKQYILYTKRGRSYGFPKTVEIDGVDMAKIKAIAISPDKKTLLFSAPTKAKGRKDLDLFYSRRSPEGFWMKPKELDSTINTIYDDSYPYFMPDKKHFIFASKGHNSMGGYDLFKCNLELDSLTMGKPDNIGYPVNTTMDDTWIIFSNSQRYAYISSLRKGGMGDLDIYRVVFEDVMPVLSYVHGQVFNADSISMIDVIAAKNATIDTLNFPVNHQYKRILAKEKDTVKALNYLHTHKIPYESLDVNIAVNNLKSNKSAGRFIVKNSDGHFVIILRPGKYKLRFSRNGYQDYYSTITIDDFDLRNRDIDLNVLLKEKP